MTRCFQIHAADNVATLLQDAAEEDLLSIVGAGSGNVSARVRIQFGHKVATKRIASGGPVIKHNLRIGIATRDVNPGDWVHLHNCRSQVDEGSSKLDVHTGTRMETVYE